MNPILMAGTTIVIFALISYSIAILTEQRKQAVSRLVLVFLTTGIILDVTATTCMIIGSEDSAFTLHGILGYSSLTGMLIDTFLIWRTRVKNGINALVPKGLHLYSRFAYIWWICAFITGGMLVAIG